MSNEADFTDVKVYWAETPMVERVTKAIRAVNADTIGLSYSELTTAMARAAIEAMQEPTREMIDAAATVDRYAEPGEEWGPMIDAALGKVDA